MAHNIDHAWGWGGLTFVEIKDFVGFVQRHLKLIVRLHTTINWADFRSCRILMTRMLSVDDVGRQRIFQISFKSITAESARLIVVYKRTFIVKL
jgi:hypothetical protein